MSEDLRETAAAMERVADIVAELRERPDLTVDAPPAELVARAVGDDPDIVNVTLELSFETPAVKAAATDSDDAQATTESESEAVATDGAGVHTADDQSSPSAPDQPSVSDQADPDQEEYPCEECDRVFDSEQGRKIHAGQVHDGGDDGDDDSATCDECGETFASEHGVTIHQATAHDDPEFDPDVERVPAPTDVFDFPSVLVARDQRLAVPDPHAETANSNKSELVTQILLAIGAEPHDATNLGKRGLRDVTAALTEAERATLQPKTKAELTERLNASLDTELSTTNSRGSDVTKRGLRLLHALVVPDVRVRGPIDDWAMIAAEAEVPDWLIESEVENAVEYHETIRGVAAELSIEDLETVRRLLWLGGWYQDLAQPEARGEHKYSVEVEA